MTTNIQRISDAEYAAALAAGRIEAEIEIRAQAVRYVPERDAIEIVTNHNAGFLIPRRWIGALQVGRGQPQVVVGSPGVQRSVGSNRTPAMLCLPQRPDG
jgi:hypothetical protein